MRRENSSIQIRKKKSQENHLKQISSIIQYGYSSTLSLAEFKVQLFNGSIVSLLSIQEDILYLGNYLTKLRAMIHLRTVKEVDDSQTSIVRR